MNRLQVQQQNKKKVLIGGAGKTINTQSEFDALTIRSGDNITLDGTFYGSLTVDKDNVTISGGILKGSQEVQDETWTDEGSGVYSLTTSEVKWLYIDGQTAVLANTGFVDLVSLPSANTFTIADNGFTNVGAYAVNRNKPWSYTRGIKVTAYSSGTATLEYNHGTSDREWVVVGDQQITDVDGRVNFYGLSEYISDNYDWAYEGGKLYVKLPSAPSNYTIHAIYKDTGVTVSGANCQINNIDISHFFKEGIKLEDGSNSVSIDSCDIYKCIEDGIAGVIPTSPYVRSGATISNCNIYDINTRGIELNYTENITIDNNSIYNIGVVANQGWLKDSYDKSWYTHMGINCRNTPFAYGNIPTGLHIHHNTVYNVSWCGIRVTRISGIIEKNHVYDYVQNLEDGGGIYTAWGVVDYPTYANLEIRYNIVHDPGTEYWNVGGMRGIYHDNGSGRNYTHHNVIYNQGQGHAINVNPGSALQEIKYNIAQTYTYYAFRHRFDNYTYGIEARDCIVSNNEFIISDNTGKCMELYGDIYSPGGEGDNNYFITPFAANKIEETYTTLAALQAAYSQDASSTVKENWLPYISQAIANDQVKIYANPTDANTSIIAPYYYEDKDGTDKGGQTVTVPSWYGVALYKSADITNTHEMLADASGEGVNIINNDCYHSDGAGTDEPFSIEFWYKTPASLGATGRLYRSIDDTGGLVTLARASNDKLVFFLSTNTSNYVNYASSDTALNTNTLYHIIITYDGTENVSGINMYVNGVAESGYTDNTVGTYTGLRAKSGNYSIKIAHDTTFPGLGSYQLFRQFNKELTSNEVTGLYNAGSPIGIDSALQDYCVQENLFNNSPNAGYWGENGTDQGTVTYTAL